jgi:hypothetical protein
MYMGVFMKAHIKCKIKECHYNEKGGCQHPKSFMVHDGRFKCYKSGAGLNISIAQRPLFSSALKNKKGAVKKAIKESIKKYFK